MRKLILFFIVVITGASCYAQQQSQDVPASSVNDSIIVEGNLLNPSYMLGSRNVSIKEVYGMLSADADCKIMCDQTKLLATMSNVFSMFGGYYLGYGASKYLFGKEDYKSYLFINTLLIYNSNCI